MVAFQIRFDFEKSIDYVVGDRSRYVSVRQPCQYVCVGIVLI